MRASRLKGLLARNRLLVCICVVMKRTNNTLGHFNRIFFTPPMYTLAGGGADFRAVFDFNGPPKTDEPRLQSSLALLSALKGLPYFITEKIDGTSGTFGFWNGELKVGTKLLE
jgi:hypothetical protein